MIMEKRNIAMQIKEMVNFIMYVLVEFVFSDSYMYFDLNLNAIIIKLHDEAIQIYSFQHRHLVSPAERLSLCLPLCFRHGQDTNSRLYLFIYHHIYMIHISYMQLDVLKHINHIEHINLESSRELANCLFVDCSHLYRQFVDCSNLDSLYFN